MDLETQWTNAANAAVAMVTTYGLRVVGAIIILVVGWMASRLLYTAVVRLCEKSPRIDRTVVLFLGNGVRYAALVFTFVAVLTTFGIATTSFVAVLGALGIAIGLALQGTLSNLAAGIMLVLFRPFHIGDRIETGGVAGKTRMINLFYTETTATITRASSSPTASCGARSCACRATMKRRVSTCSTRGQPTTISVRPSPA
jgi:small conductance mechanosensitive channel